jgi:hypothetical protein
MSTRDARAQIQLEINNFNAQLQPANVRISLIDSPAIRSYLHQLRFQYGQHFYNRIMKLAKTYFIQCLNAKQQPHFVPAPTLQLLNGDIYHAYQIDIGYFLYIVHQLPAPNCNNHTCNSTNNA